ncbi:YoaK family protein [Nocardiopsis coralliicola]
MRADRDTPYLVGLLVLTVATGVVDAVSYLALDRVFTGNMTGNVLFVGFGIAGAGSLSLLKNAVALAGFLAGAVTAGRIVRGRRHGTRLPTAHLLLLAGAAAAIMAIGLLWLLVDGIAGGWLLGVTAVLAAAMGMQAVAARGAGISDVTTVVVTSTLVNFVLDSPLAGGAGERWARRVGAVLSMAAGGALGALLVNAWSGAAALLTGGACMAAGALTLAIARRLSA